MRKRKASSAKVEISKEKSESAPDFECNVCLELAKEPVVTCCGHLFCWPCLYQWLHVHCSYQECPVCKGKVNESSIVPVYGRGSLDATVKKEGEENGDPRLRVPPRPQGNRVESLRQHLQSSPLRGPAASLERLRVLFEDDNQGAQFVPVEGRNPWVLTRHSSPNSQISASSSLHHQDGAAASQQRAAIDGSISRFSAFLAEIRSLSRRSVEAVGIASAENQHDFGPVVSQTSNSSTMAMILGNIDASTEEPSRGGSPMLLRGRATRRRRRSIPGVSQGSNAAGSSSDGPNRRGSSMVLRSRGRNSTAAMQGDTSAETNASSVEPDRGGFTMVLRRGRGRSSDSSSMDHVGQRRRLD